MVRTLGLRRALHVEGRGDRADEEEVGERRRSTASARRKRAGVSEFDGTEEEGVQEQEEVIGHVPDEKHRFPGGPFDTSVLTSYSDHVACKIWEGEERDELKLASHGRKIVSLGTPVAEIQELVARTGLSPLISCCIDTGDRCLLSALAERWHRETCSFHLPIGEVTVTLDDVSSLLHLPCLGAFHTYEAIDVLKAAHMLVDLLGVSGQQAIDELNQRHGVNVRLSWLRDIYHQKCQQGEWTSAARAYLLHLVGCTLFANKSSTHVSVVFLDAFRDFDCSGGYAWGAAALVHLYDNLNDASMYKTKHLAGFITLLQTWIYEHFPTVGSMLEVDDYDECQPRACRWKCGKAYKAATYRMRLDAVTPESVIWMPYHNHRAVKPFEMISLFSGSMRWGHLIHDHLPERVMRQFGFVQRIPPPPSDPTALPLTVEEIDDRWIHFSEFLAEQGDIAVVPFQCAPEYIHWFFSISHPFIIPPEAGQPPRQAPVFPDAAPPAIPEPTPVAADIPRHATGVCERIAGILQNILDGRMVPADTEVHDMIQHCITLATGVTDEGNVYVRSRRRAADTRERRSRSRRD